MNKLFIETDRLTITEFDICMVESVYENSLDEDNRRFVPDEVFDTVEKARQMVHAFIEWYKEDRAPFVYPILLKSGVNIGYVQAVPFYDDDWEIGYHIAKKYTGHGYATEAVKAFLPIIMNSLSLKKIFGICIQENTASCAVMQKCGFVLEHSGAGNYQGQSRNICSYIFHVQDLATYT